MPEAIFRLVQGISPQVLESLIGLLKLDTQAAAGLRKIAISAGLIPIASSAMPLQDAIDLARYLVELTINFQRFLPSAKIVGGPIEIATMTKYEGFKWIERKHYYGSALNPKE